MLTAIADRTLVEVIPAPPDRVRAHYVDLDNIKDVHPLVVSVRTVSRAPTVDGYEHTYRVRDRIPLGVVSLPIVYTATLTVPAGGPVRARARQFPGVRLDAVVTFEPVPGGTRLTERLRIGAPRPLLAVTVSQALTAHREMLAGIRRHFEA